ncbi:hypothetical protein BDV30DRAFT_247927 [Aspergillus minisclerotigenes]|uniref:Peptidase metallopeptidase domain-containing protein n=1 Tax=Aspergillus minisclerotigenes TaxID=656917 RepID=A0A5N6JA98_9EURO|nr:hypothetical protein BDV30DRAFT_247927 [Aspergillus minisclerotigenes]
MARLKVMSNTKKDRVKKWKESAGEKSLETLPADRPSQAVAGVVDLQEKNNVAIADSAYHCITQSALPENISVSDPAGLQLGMEMSGNRFIPRWKRNSEVKFAAFANGYATSDQAQYAASMLKKAADTWNDLDLGVKFSWTNDIEDAAFVLGYGGDGGSTLARAFFPNEQDLNMLYVYKGAFEPGRVNYMKNIFLHELGHVLGLRHEFAPEREGGTVQLGIRNAGSVMSNVFPPDLQASDEDSTREFYNLADDAKIGGWPLKLFVPNN